MLRVFFALTLAVGAIFVFGQPALAKAHRHSGVSVHRHDRILYGGRNQYYSGWAAQSREADARRDGLGTFDDRGWKSDQGDSNFGAHRYFGASNRRSQLQNQTPDPWAANFAVRRDFDPAGDHGSRLEAMVEQQASAAGVPASLVHRVITRESGYNPRAVSSGNYGLMQIRLGTARAMGYGGTAAGLLDPETNMTYAVRYLAGAYRAAGGNENRAVAFYARGYNAPRLQEASLQMSASAATGPFFAYSGEGATQWSAAAGSADFNYAGNPPTRRRHSSFMR
jgi:soluble lytic murein transglycosylase-like protein